MRQHYCCWRCLDYATYSRHYCSWHCWSCTQRNLFKILLNQTEIRLYLPFSDWFGTKLTSVWFQINRKMVNIIWFKFDLIRFRKDFSVCMRKNPFISLLRSQNIESLLYNLFFIILYTWYELPGQSDIAATFFSSIS